VVRVRAQARVVADPAVGLDDDVRGGWGDREREREGERERGREGEREA